MVRKNRGPKNRPGVATGAFFASRGSGHSAAERLLHACDSYALLLWQSVVARIAPLSAFGAYGSGEWLGPDLWRPLGGVPRNLTLPG